MKEPILMPVFSDTTQTGRLIRWDQSVGDPGHKGEAIAEVETDKAILAVSVPGADGKTNLTLSCDHRVIFGADAARFLQRLRECSQNPAWLA